MSPIALNWSSGKDAALAYSYLLNHKEYKVKTLLTTLSETYNRVSMHGTHLKLLELQAERMKVSLKKISLSENGGMDVYNNIMQKAIDELKEEDIYSFAFGDIFLEDLRKYREEQLSAVGAKALFPLWKKDTTALVQEIEDIGIKAVIVCVNDQYLDKDFLGRYINRELLQDLPKGVDPCGEHGEYHTAVVDAPFFREPISVGLGEVVSKSYASAEGDRKWDNSFHYLDLLPL